MVRHRRAVLGLLGLGLAATAACGSGATKSGAAKPSMSQSTSPATSSPAQAQQSPPGSGQPTPPGATGSAAGIYAADGPNMLVAATRGVPSRVYVPNHGDGTITVIDPASKRVIDTFTSGPGTQHVVPAWDLRTLYAANDEGGNSLTPIDPTTGRRGGPNIGVSDPYNMYFTPDGRYAIVIEEAEHKLTFRDPHTFRLKDTTHVTCSGVNHVDFSADGAYFIATCEFDGHLVKVDTASHRVLGYLAIGGMPQDIKVDPAGKVWYVSDMQRGGVHLIDGDALKEIGFVPTGPEAHGLYPSRDASKLYISNRGGPADNGSVSVLDFATRSVVATWPIPAPSTPDMGGVSADGQTLWLSGRRTSEVYAIDTTSGRLVARIRVGHEPHGLAVWPQPGRYSLGHTGILR